MKNITNKTKTILFASLIAALVVPFSSMGQADASMYNNWSNGDQTYTCTNSFANDLDTTNNVSECSDLATAVYKWDSVWFSSWDLTHQTVGTVPYFACDIGGLGYTVPTPSYPNNSPDISDAYVCITENLLLGDVPAGDSTSYDFITLLIHETGHVAGLDHSTESGSVMVSGQAKNTSDHTLSWGDQSDLQGDY